MVLQDAFQINRIIVLSCKLNTRIISIQNVIDADNQLIIILRYKEGTNILSKKVLRRIEMLLPLFVSTNKNLRGLGQRYAVFY
jgi:hypothetical protein